MAPGKKHSILVLAVPDAQIANQGIRKGLVINIALHVAEYNGPQSGVL